MINFMCTKQAMAKKMVANHYPSNKGELIKEHKRLVPALKKAGLNKEANIQAKDLKELKQ